ncbi:hypothetical protein [Polaromonas sp. JS666]|uniref:hypothetical protein n=1 Tax=Polaromonas sp. (strain JS666 / ATCC BAA-500) TaxID=296591 RepID=UPI000891A01E|nr:hypothetical protein [Polaromonas sp. JS666]SDM54938.1 hypothetical protein SAMN05720382_101731 [Polaromonas sp. JS666]
MKLIRRRKNVAASDPYNTLANPIAASVLTSEQYMKAVATFISFESDSLLEVRFRALFEKPRFRNVFNSEAVRIEDFADKKIVRARISPRRAVGIYRGIIAGNREKLALFYASRRQYERAFLLGDFVAAEAIAERLKSDCGESLWYVRSKMVLLSKQGRLDEMEKFAAECKARTTSGFIEMVFSWYLLLASDPLLHLRKVVTSTIKELAEGQQQDWSDFFSLMFIPASMVPVGRGLSCLTLVQILPVVDQACLLEALIGELDSSGEDVLDGMKLLLIDLKKLNLPSEISTIHALVQYEEEMLYRLIASYELGNYPEMFQLFSDSFSRSGPLFAPLNLLAKATASGGGWPLISPESPLGQLILILGQIYMLDSQPGKLEDDYLAQVITLNGFNSTGHLQLSLYKALPYRLPRKRRGELARYASNGSEQGTPLSSLLLVSTEPVLEYQYSSDVGVMPEHRRIKQEIRRTWKVVRRDSIEDLLSRYAELTPLKKDHLELAAAYYLASAAHDSLVKFGARALASNPNAYVALPMEEMLGHVEVSRASHIEAVIISYFYAKRIDKRKEYVLNETYEEFLLTQGAERPIALLEKLDMNDPLSVVLLRDVSALDAMDFLGCFEDSNDLRSERIRILDYLKDHQAIDPEAHGQEVDEIVGQVVIDAGATEFNESKIDVNSAAIKRKLMEDVTSLLKLYKSFSTEKEEKVIRVGMDDTEQDSIQALVVGDRNTTLLRLLNLIRDAFVNDEKYGLDKNLSTEIRHGFFSNLIRSRLEDRRLITEIDDSGKYKRNEYWLQANSLLHEEILKEIDEHLSWFSASFNALVSKAEEWMKVTSEVNEFPNRVFRYPLYMSEFSQFHPIASKANAEEFLDFCISRLWVETEASLVAMRELLNVEFKQEVGLLFDELLERITEAKKNAAMLELMTAIVQVRRDIQEDITTVSEWFKRNEGAFNSDRYMVDILDISVECFARVRGMALDVDIKACETETSLKLEGQQVKAFIVVLVNLFENCCRKSGFGGETKVRVFEHGNNSSWSLRICNDLSPSRLAECTPEYVRALDLRMRSTKSLELMRTEGGTGLSKVFNQLRLISDRFNVELSVVGRSFEVEITYEKNCTSS